MRVFENWNRFYDPAVGRYTAPESELRNPRWLFDGAAPIPVGIYAYAANSPILVSDLTGLAPGDPFESPEDAAKDAQEELKKDCPSGDKKTCTNKNVEWGTVIYKRSDGSYTYLPWRTDNKNSEVNLVGIDDPSAVAGVHSHPNVCTDARCKGTDLNSFSPPDIRQAAVKAKDSFLVAPNGALKMFDVYEGWRPGTFGGDYQLAGEKRLIVPPTKTAPVTLPKPRPVRVEPAR